MDAHRSPHLLGPQMGLCARIVNMMVALVLLLGPSAAAEPAIRIVAFGDSLTAGYMLPASAAFPAQLEAKLRARGHAGIEVINAGVSGDTTASGVERLEWAISGKVDAVIVELGANDSLRGLPPALARKNLDAIITRLRDKGIEVLLAGMRAPRNLGESYVHAFDTLYPDLAKAHDVLLYPFFLEGAALVPSLTLDDGLHPNEKGVARIVEGILPSVEALIERVRARRASTARG